MLGVLKSLYLTKILKKIALEYLVIKKTNKILIKEKMIKKFKLISNIYLLYFFTI